MVNIFSIMFVSMNGRTLYEILLEPCPEDSRDFTLIQYKLRESRLDIRKEHANAWLWKDVKLVHNDDFLREFSEKRSEMRTKGRHGREMEEHYCFVVASSEATSQIYQFGLRTESQDQCSLGKPSHGVYLFKHVDVALKHAAASTCNGKYLIIFKVLFGKVKKVTPSLEWNKTVDPMVGFDCHMAKDAVSYRDSLSQQVLGSSVFLFDYNENQELNTRPRQCLPYAVVSFVPAVNATAATTTSPPLSPTKTPADLNNGPLEHLKGCTVAKRTGKGENATVTFKRFATTQGSQGVEYQSQTPTAEINGVDATLFPYSDLQTPAPFIPHQHYVPYYNTAEYFNPSLPYYDSGIPWQHYLDKSALFSNIHNLNSTSIYGGSTDTVEVIPQMSSEKISTIVYSSRLVKDPRLSRQDTNIQKKSSEEERASVPECEEQGYKANSQNQKEENYLTLSCEKQSLELDEHKGDRIPKPVLDDPGKANLTVQTKAENMPSIKLFKMKFQKYGAYFKMTEEERHAKIWSKENLSTEQKQLLIDRIHFYEMHHKRYKQGLLFQKDIETETAFSSSQAEPQTDAVCPATLQHSPLMTKGNQCEVNQSHMRHSVSAPVSNLTSTTGLVDNQKNEVDVLTSDSDQLSQDICRQKEKSVQEKEQGSSSDSQIEPQDGGVVESVKEKEMISETVQGNMQPDPLEKNQTLESPRDFEQSSCPSIVVEANNQDVHKSEIPTSPKESFACKPTLSNTIEDCPEFEQHIIDIEVANCVDVSATEVPECSDCSYVNPTEPGHNSQNSNEKQDREALTHSKSDANSEMSIEVERGEAQQHNTIYNALYKRLQLDQLLSNSNEANFFSNKSYLRPKGVDKTPVINLPDSHINETMLKEEDLQLILKLKSNQKPPEKLTLSERFSKLRCLGQNLAAFVHENRLNHSYPAHSNGDLKYKPEALISCSDGEKVTGNNNAELIKLMAQRYNENSLIANCKRVRQKRSKVLRRKISRLLRSRPSGQLPFHVLSKTRHIRKIHLLKAKSKQQKTKLALNMSSCGQDLFNKSTSESASGLSCIETANNADKDSASHLNSATALQTGSQSHGQLPNKESNQNDNASNISTEEGSCVDSENKTGHGDETRQTKAQFINPAEIVYHDASELSSHNNLNTSLESITVDSEEPVIIEEIETNCGTNNNKTSHQEQSSLVTCCGSNESSNGECVEAEYKEEALLQKKLSQEASKEISPNYNTGAYEDTRSPVPTVSSIPSDITSGNVISSCTAKAQRAMTPDSPRVMNNEIDTQTKAGILCDDAVDNSGSGLSTNKSEQIDKNANLQDNNNPKSTDANEKGIFSRKEVSEAECLNTPTGAKDNVAEMFTETTIHLPRLASESQHHPSLQDTKSSGIVNSVVETTSDFQSRSIKDAQEDVTVIKDNLHSVWQGQDKNSLPPTSDTQIISKLRDYLTKFEFTVKKQDTVNNMGTEHHAPMAWITLDSTAHKQQLYDSRHYSRQGLADITHRQSEVVHFQGGPTKHKQSNEDGQPNSSISKKRRMSNMERVSPDSTFTETVRNEPNSHLLNKDIQPYHTASGVPNMNHWLQNHGNKLQENQITCPQGLGNLSQSSVQQGTGSREKPCQIKQPNEQSAYEKVHTTYIQNKYSVTDISNTLKLADHAVSLTELGPLQSKCKRMLQHFISNFEKDQNVSFHQSCITRNLILEKYLEHPPAPLELKFEAINSFLELQMIVEACQFVDNKMNFLRRKPTFRSLLWYDPSLYGELYKGTVGFQQQSSLFSAFQQCLTSEDYRRLREYYCAVSTLHQQLQDAPDTSYYMYLKTKRERLEIEAAFRNPSDVKSFFLSVPTAIMINFGDSLEILKKTHNIVSTFIETPADRLPGTFDVGKAEHLSIICRYLQEKILFLKSHKEITKISWFGMEHLLYDASKVLVWSESEHGMPNEVLTKYNRLNSQIVYGVTEACVALVNKADPSSQPADVVQFPPPHQVNAVRIPSAGFSTERTQTALNIHMEDGTKETHQPPRR
ncbi:testis-expressed sequence 15 protein isoform X1, partial [Clarias magur]